VVGCIKGSESPKAYAVYVWKELIKPRTKAQNIAVVAHSYGGLVVTNLVCSYQWCSLLPNYNTWNWQLCFSRF